MAGAPLDSRTAQLGFCPIFISGHSLIGGSLGSRGNRCALVSLAACIGIFLDDAAGQRFNPQGRDPTTQGSGLGRRGGAEVAHVGDQRLVIDAERRVRHSVVSLVRRGCLIGAGVVISRAQRLVVTAGHVADTFLDDRSFGKSTFGDEELYAFFEGSAQPYRADKVWYHPRVRREFDYGLAANSLDPSDGPIEYPSPDIALVQLSPESGDLPLECGVQIQCEPRAVNGCSVGVLGFWRAGKDYRPGIDRPATASFLTGVIRPANDELERKDQVYGQLVFLDAGCTNLDGISGGPIFLGNGTVAALAIRSNSWGKPPREHEELVGLRIDCLRELVTYHKLGGWLPGLAEAAPRADWGPDARIHQLRRAVSLMRQARDHRKAGRNSTAVGICNDVLGIAPDYGGALLERSKAYLFFLGSQWNRLTVEERRQYSSWATSDSERCNDANPRSNHVRMIHLQNIIFETCAYSEQAGFQYVVERTTKVLSPEWSGEPLTDHERGFALNLRAQAHYFLEEMKEAEDDYGRSVHEDPHEPRWYLNRAQFWDQMNRPDLANADRRRSSELRPSGIRH
jgi:tetratricopeptide (TPR) repeat protein